MKVLIVKTSSLGDVIHTLPALSDAARALPDIRFDWVVEEALAEIPAWHPAVERVIPIALRRWRKQPSAALTGGEWRQFLHQLRTENYDKIIDAQGLIKSAVITRLARGPRYGLDRRSAREPLAALAYGHKISVEKKQHAITRVRALFAAALNYPCPATAPDYGLSPTRFEPAATDERYMVFLHGTAWSSKQWPLGYWLELARLAAAQGYKVYLPWGNPNERQRARHIAAHCSSAVVLPEMNLAALAALLAHACGVVGVDTGLSHLAAALAAPAVTIYGATRPELTGTVGASQVHLCAKFPCAPCGGRVCAYQGAAPVQPACYQTIPPTQVWGSLTPMLLTEGRSHEHSLG